MNEKIRPTKEKVSGPGEKQTLARESQTFLATVLGENPITDSGNPYAPYLTRSILLEEASPPKNVRATINLISILLAGFIIWATIAQVDERASAPGEILPIGFVQPVQHLEGGILSEILVVEGQLVKMGEPVMMLDDTAFRAEFNAVRARNVALVLEIERLSAFAMDRDPDFSIAGEGFDSMIADHEQILASQIAARSAQINVILAQIHELEEEISGLKAQEVSLAEEVGYVQEEVDLRGQLLEQGLTSRLLYLTAQRDLSRSKGQLAEIQTKQAQTSAEIERARERIAEVEGRLRNDALNNMGDAASEQAQVGAQLARFEDRVLRTIIVAPISGRVQGLVIRPAGGIILPGEPVMDIVPMDQELVAEIKVSPRDIGHISPGDEVVIKLETYNFIRYGSIPGVIDRVSASSFMDGDGDIFFRAYVRLERDFVGDDPNANLLAPGMTLVADIKTGEKSVLAYLWRPIKQTFSESFAER